MTPVRLRLVAPVRMLHTLLRPIIGTASAARRLPVPLLWRKRRPTVASLVPRHAPNRRIDHFHHWSARLEFDWRVGIVAPLATTLMSAPVPARINSVTSASPAMRPAVQRWRTIDRHFDPARPARFLQQAPPTFRPLGARAVPEPSKPAPASRIVRRSDLTHVVNTELRSMHRRRAVSQQTVWPGRAYIAPPERSVSATTVMRQLRCVPAVRWIDAAAPASFARRSVIRLATPAIAPLDLAPAAVSLPRRQVRPPVTLIWRPKDGTTAAQRVAASALARVEATDAVPAMRHSASESAPVTTVMRSNTVISNSSSTAAAPDFNRIVDEVMRRIDRHTRSERQRRGL